MDEACRSNFGLGGARKTIVTELTAWTTSPLQGHALLVTQCQYDALCNVTASSQLIPVLALTTPYHGGDPQRGDGRQRVHCVDEFGSRVPSSTDYTLPRSCGRGMTMFG